MSEDCNNNEVYAIVTYLTDEKGDITESFYLLELFETINDAEESLKHYIVDAGIGVDSIPIYYGIKKYVLSD